MPKNLKASLLASNVFPFVAIMNTMGLNHKNHEDYYSFEPDGLMDSFRLFIHLKDYSLTDLFKRSKFYVKKGEIREIVEFGKLPTVEIRCRTHCSDGVFCFSKEGVKKALGPDYSTFVIEGSVKKFLLSSDGEGRPFVILFAVIGFFFVLCQAFKNWLFPYCTFAKGSELAICQMPLVQYSIESSASSLMYVLWALTFIILGIYFSYYVTKKEKYSFCLKKSKWIGIFLLVFGIFFSVKLGKNFLENDRYKISYSLFKIARDPASVYNPEFNEIRKSLEK